MISANDSSMKGTWNTYLWNTAKKKWTNRKKDIINSFFFNYNSRIIQEHFQAEIGGKKKNIQPGSKKQHSCIKKECRYEEITLTSSAVSNSLILYLCPSPAGLTLLSSKGTRNEYTHKSHNRTIMGAIIGLLWLLTHYCRLFPYSLSWHFQGLWLLPETCTKR